MKKDREDCRTTFAVTLRDALQRHRKRTGESAREVCEKIGLGEKGYRWLRKISSKGISHVRTDRHADLKKVCNHIDLNYAWLFAVAFGSAEKSSTDFAKIVALGIAEAARQSGTPVHNWHEIGRKFQSDLEEMISGFLHKFSGEFGRHLASELAEEVRREQVAESKRKADKEAAADKALWEQKTAAWGESATPPAFPVIRKEIWHQNNNRAIADTEIHEDTWNVRPLTNQPNTAIEVSVEATHRSYATNSHGRRSDRLLATERRIWRATVYFDEHWHIVKEIDYSHVAPPEPTKET
jgi:hypothetical protein